MTDNKICRLISALLNHAEKCGMLDSADRIYAANLLCTELKITAFEDFISKVFESVYASANLDEYLQTKQLIQFYMTNDSINRFYDVEVSAVTNEATAKALATQIRSYSNKIEFMSAKYNYAGVTTHTPKEDQVLLLNSDTEAFMDVNVLAYAFNMEKADPSAIVSKVVTLDDFGDGDSTTVAILVDRDWFMIYSQLYQMEEQNKICWQSLHQRHILTPEFFQSDQSDCDWLPA